MPLPILKTPVESDSIRLFHRMSLHFAQHLGETAQLEVGTAIINPQLNEVDNANLILDAALPEGMPAGDAVALVDAHFAAAGCRCRQWVMNPSAKADAVQPLVDQLIAGGAREDVADVLYLTSQPNGVLRHVEGLKIIPARAGYKLARQLAEQAAPRVNGPQWVEAHLLHLDDPHWDALLALKDGQAIAYMGVLAVGEAGLIEHVFVAEPFRRQGVGRLMMGRALEICARSLFKHVMLPVRPENAAAQAMVAGMGFRKIGQRIGYCPDESR